jgi:hypothetical protein
MLRQVSFLLFFLQLSACSLFKTRVEAPQSSIELLSAVKMVGEGRGRLGFQGRHYLFSYEAILKPEGDWLMAASIPLHGEEILEYPGLYLEAREGQKRKPFEQRLETGISHYLQAQKKSPQLAQVILNELRNMIRFLQARELGLTVVCKGQNQIEFCKLDSREYQVETNPSQLKLKKVIQEDLVIEYVAQNLTTSNFRQSGIFFYYENDRQKRGSLLSIELFWD